MTSIYIPSHPYVFQSGKRAGKCMELMMFSDYSFLKWFSQKMESECRGTPNECQKHLAWLISKGELIRPVAICPHCKVAPVTRCSVLYNPQYGQVSVGLWYTCCSDVACAKKVEDMSIKPVTFHPLKFSSILRYSEKSCQKDISDLLRGVHELPKVLKKERAFQFFSQAS